MVSENEKQLPLHISVILERIDDLVIVFIAPNKM